MPTYEKPKAVAERVLERGGSCTPDEAKKLAREVLNQQRAEAEPKRRTATSKGGRTRMLHG